MDKNKVGGLVISKIKEAIPKPQASILSIPKSRNQLSVQ